MNIAAIIAEYNPFHIGHAYHIECTKNVHGATHVVSIMSGDFVQRGDAAVADKHTRAQMALRGGADLVVELPLPWAMSGAETFARGGVGLVSALGCVEMLSFGSECGDVDLLVRTAELCDSKVTAYSLQTALSEGLSYASARSRAVESVDPKCSAVLSSPNDTLGVEYCRALRLLSANIRPVCVRRTGAAHDSLSANGDPSLPVSASYIRQQLSDGCDYAAIANYLPREIHETLADAIRHGHAPADISRLDTALLMHLRRMSCEDIARLPDVSEGLEHRIRECAASASSENVGFLRLCDAIKCKRYTHARIRRILLSAFLGVDKDDAAGIPPYIRVLAMNRRGQEILSAAKGLASLPIITRVSQVRKLSAHAQHIFELCSLASDIYGLLLPSPAPAGRDLSARLIVE